MFKKQILLICISAVSIIKADESLSIVFKRPLIAGNDLPLTISLYNMLDASEKTEMAGIIKKQWNKNYIAAGPDIETVAKSYAEFQAKAATNAKQAFVSLITDADQPGYKVIKALNPSANPQGVIKTALGDQ